MPFTSRFICMSPRETPSIEEIRRIIEERDVIKSKIENEFKLESWIKLSPTLVSYKDEKFLEGVIFHQHIQKIPDYVRKGRDIEEIYQPIRKTSKVRFWFSSNPGVVLFNNRQNGNTFGRRILSLAIFNIEDRILPVTFRISDIEKDYYETVWTHSFQNRQGNIIKGQHYGNQIVNDPMYGETIGAPRNFIGVLSSSTNPAFKVRINRNGVITIFKDLNDPAELPTVFRIIHEFLPYSVATYY